MKYITLILFLIFFKISDCQTEVDSTKFVTSINFNFNNRFSYFNKNLYSILGFKMGFTMLKKHKVGIGFNYLYSHIYDNSSLTINNITYELKSPLKYYFITGFYEPIFYQNKHWELSVPIHLGIGESYFLYWLNGNRMVYDKSTIINMEVVVGGHYKFFWWMGVGSGVGYNYNLKTNNFIEQDFNGPVFYAKIKIFVGDIFKYYMLHRSGVSNSR